MRRLTATATALALSPACGPPGTRIVVLDSVAGGEYALRTVEFETLDDVETLSGSVTRVRGGAKLVIDAAAAEGAEDLADLIDRALRDAGSEVKFSAVEGEDGWVPEDYDSLAMATVYYGLERASRLFADLGVSPDRMGSIPTYYLIEFVIDLRPQGPRTALTDNAAYSLLPGLDGFLVLEQKRLQELPLSMNRTVMVHEYSHAVFSRLLHGGPPPAVALGDDEPYPGFLPLKTMDEGSADYFAAVETGDPDILRWSIPAGTVDSTGREIDRALDVRRELTDEIVLMNLGFGEMFDPYAGGSVWASALWALGVDLDRREVATALVGAIGDLAGVGGDAITLATLPDLLARRLGEGSCAVLLDRFALVAGEIEACDGR